MFAFSRYRSHRTALLFLALGACGEEETSSADAATDASVTDAGLPHTSSPDAGAHDAASTDASTTNQGDASNTADAASNADAASADTGTGSSGGRGVGQLCGGIAGFRCDTGLFCDYSTTAGGTGCVGIADASGKCATVPDACPDVYSPVCSCTYHSYGNACEANSAGASVGHDGLCTAEECTNQGGTPVYSNGASTPTCKTGESSFPIPGKEAALCCVPAP